MEKNYDLFIGWISEDDKLVYDWQVLYSENLDLTSNSNYVSLSQKPTNLFTATDYVQTMYYLRRWYNKLICWLWNRQIYYWWEKQTNNSSSLIKAFWSNSKYLYYLESTESVKRILLTDLHQSDWSAYLTETITWWTLANTWDNKVFIVENENNAFLFYWTNIVEIDNDTGWLLNTKDFLYDRVVWVAYISSSIYIFQADWRVFLWDWISDSYSESFNLWIAPDIIKQSANNIYVVWEWSLYQLNWYTLEKIWASYYSDVLNSNKFNFADSFASVLWFMKQIVYIWWNNILSFQDSTWTDKFWDSAPLVTFWIKKTWFPYAVNNWISTGSNDIPYEVIYWVTAWSVSYNSLNDKVYIAYQDANWNYWVDEVNVWYMLNRTLRKWVLVFPTFDWWDKRKSKRLAKVKITADLNNKLNWSSWEFRFYNLVDWTLVPLVGWDIAKSKITWDKLDEYTLMVNSNFHDMNLAVVFNQYSDYFRNGWDMKLYSLTLDYDFNK